MLSPTNVLQKLFNTSCMLIDCVLGKNIQYGRCLSSDQFCIISLIKVHCKGLEGHMHVLLSKKNISVLVNYTDFFGAYGNSGRKSTGEIPHDLILIIKYIIIFNINNKILQKNLPYKELFPIFQAF